MYLKNKTSSLLKLKKIACSGGYLRVHLNPSNCIRLNILEIDFISVVFKRNNRLFFLLLFFIIFLEVGILLTVSIGLSLFLVLILDLLFALFYYWDRYYVLAIRCHNGETHHFCFDPELYKKVEQSIGLL
jgi:hypothetical protein